MHYRSSGLGKPPVFFSPYSLANPSGLRLLVSADAPGLLLEERGFVDGRELDSFKGHKSSATCDHFDYLTLGQCQLLGSCHLRQGLLTPGAHPLRSCEYLSYCSAADPYKEGA